MDVRWRLVILVYGLIVLIVTFAVLCGASQLSAAIGDRQGATLLWRIATACLILLVIDILLLVGVLSVRALDEVDKCADEKRDSSGIDADHENDSATRDT